MNQALEFLLFRCDFFAFNILGCENKGIGMFCDHYAAFMLRESIILESNDLPKNSKGFPVAFSHNYSDQYVMEIINPSLNKSGQYYLRTGPIFGGK